MIYLALVLALLTGGYPGFQPPPEGMGEEMQSFSARAYALGGISVGITDGSRLSVLNPAASAWAENSGICFSGILRSGDAAPWSSSVNFPSVSALFPVHKMIVLSASIDARSSLEQEAAMSFPDYTGNLTWSGGLSEVYTGFSVAVSELFAFSLGGKCTFGEVESNVILSPAGQPHNIPINTIYRDNTYLQQAWGGVLGLMLNTDYFSLGFSVTTDRSGDVEIVRDYSGSGADSSETRYSIPGELSAGLSFNPIRQLMMCADIYTRKAMNVMGSHTDDGWVLSAGTELDVGRGVDIRAGFEHIDGLWLDGANRITFGTGFGFGDGRAGIDIAGGYQIWEDEAGESFDETTIYLTLLASGYWLD